MPEQNNLQDQHFNVRLKVSDVWTKMMVEFLKETGHIEDYRESTLEEDKNLLIDYWFKYPDESEFVPVAFKLRIDPARRDIPVVYSQPFYGTNGEKTVLGRDFRCLQGQVREYYVAVKNADKEFCEIYRISKQNLYPKINQMIESWKNDENVSSQFITFDKLTEARNEILLKNLNWGKGVRKIWQTENGEIWWQKNPNEKFSKINLYVPENFKEQSFPIPSEAYQRMLEKSKQDS